VISTTFVRDCDGVFSTQPVMPAVSISSMAIKNNLQIFILIVPSAF
jgi:hypothetical protein